MKKPKKKLFITLGIIAAAIIAVIVLFPGNDTVPTVAVSALSKGEIVNSVNVSGKVKSAGEYSIYAKESLPVQEIFVQEGDVVKQGDILAILDTSTVSKDLERMDVALESAANSLTEEQKNIDANIVNAQISLETAKLALEKQQLYYDTVKQEYDEGKNAELLNAKNSVDMSEMELATSKKNYENAKVLYESQFLSQVEFTNAETAFKNSQLKYDTAVENYNKAKDALEKSYKQAQIDIQTAKKSYENAQNALNTAKDKSTTASNYNLESQQIDKRKLEDRLNNATIQAPADGTITRVNLKVGQVPAGVIFEIENMEELIVTTYIKEYTISQVQVGQKVILKADGANNEPINGEVIYIAPTSRKDVVDTGNSEFETKVRIVDKDTGLRIGMEARLDIIIESKDDVFYIPYDAIVTKEDDQQVIYVVDNGVVKEIAVETGIESDLYVEISGAGLTEEMNVIPNPADYQPGDAVTVI